MPQKVWLIDFLEDFAYSNNRKVLIYSNYRFNKKGPIKGNNTNDKN